VLFGLEDKFRVLEVHRGRFSEPDGPRGSIAWPRVLGTGQQCSVADADEPWLRPKTPR
jgi:hypothetical protein